jgi:MFS family permease
MARNTDFRQGRNHLPQGHEPGPQTRRAARGAPIGILFLGVASLGFVAGAVILFAGASHDKSPSGARVGAAFFVAAAIAFALLLAWLLRRRHPHQARYLQLTVAPLEARRGGTVTATVTITDAAKLGDALELGLLCTEYYDVKQEVYTQNGSHEQRVLKSAEAYTTWNALDRATVQQSIRFTVPATSPFSYEGGTVSWAWHVALRDRHAHRPDAVRDVPIWVSP